MLNDTARPVSRQRGATLIEVLIAILLLAFGLLGLAGLQTRVHSMQFEAFQRAQALFLLTEMSDRISANRANAGSYVIAGTVGTGDLPADCSTKPMGAARDLCEWSNALKGASETAGTSKAGAMIGALGCITQIQAQDASTGVCTPAIYQVTVAWQGLSPTKAQAIICGKNSFGNDDSLRRAISTQAVVSLPQCS